MHLIAYDEASDVIDTVGSNLSVTLTDIDGNTQQLASTTTDATSQMTDGFNQVDSAAQTMQSDMDNASSSATNSAMSMNSCALAGMGLFMSFERIQNSQVSLDRANLMVEKSTVSVEVAQNAYNAAVKKFGEDSPQAQLALQKLQNAQDALTVAHERADMAQRNYNNSIMMAALTIIPSLIAVVNTIANAESIWEGIQWALNAAMDANPAAIICLAIAGLVAIIVAAYNACPPFRDALNAIGAVLGGALKVAVEAITVGLTWFWKNVIEPVANFIRAYVVVEVEALSIAFSWLWNNILEPLGNFLRNVFYASIKVISDVVGFLWNNVLKPFGDFLIGAFSDAWKGLKTIIDWFYDAIKPIIDAVSKVADTLGGFVNAVGGAMKGAGNAIGGFIHSICFAHALADASESSEKTMKGWVGMVGDSMNKGLASIKDFNSQAQIAGMAGVGVANVGGGIPTTTNRPTAVTVVTQAPLVNIEGSADKATVDLASKQVLASLKTIIVEPTSSGAAATQKKIRSGSVFSS